MESLSSKSLKKRDIKFQLENRKRMKGGEVTIPINDDQKRRKKPKGFTCETENKSR